MLGGPAVEHVEVDAVQHGHAVPHARGQLFQSERDVARIDRPAVAHVARRLDEHEADAAGAALLVALHRVHDRAVVDGGVERGRQPARREQLADLGAQRVLAGEPQRGEQPERDGLAVAVARVARRGLDRVARPCARG